MTLGEAKKIAVIVETADGRCPICIANLVTQLQIDFPEFEWIFKEIEYEVFVEVRDNR